MSQTGLRRTPAKTSPFEAACVVDLATFTIAAQVSRTINVAMQLKDADGNALVVRGAVDAYLSDNADGSTLTASTPTSTVAIGTNGLLINQVTDKAFKLVSNASGQVDINVINSGSHTYYLALVMPDGGIQVSGAIAIV